MRKANHHLWYKTFVFGLGLLWCVPGNPSGELALRTFLKNLRNLTGTFTQTVTVGGVEKKSEAASGTFAFSRPGKFVWEIRQPEFTSIVSNGRKVWIYDKALEQVTVQKLGKGVPVGILEVLLGESDITRDFEVKDVSQDAVQAVQLVPKKDAGFVRAVLSFEKDKLTECTVEDAFGQVSRYRFASLDASVRFTSKNFEFTIPEGVDVIEN